MKHANKGAFLNDITNLTQNWPPYPLFYIKMTVSLTTFYWVSHNSIPPSPYLCDVIYEWSLSCSKRKSIRNTAWIFVFSHVAASFRVCLTTKPVFGNDFFSKLIYHFWIILISYQLSNEGSSKANEVFTYHNV